MNDRVMNWWNRCSDDYYSGLSNQPRQATKRPNKGFLDLTRAFQKPTWEMINKAFSDLRGKRALVPSSGDRELWKKEWQAK